jgi:hypothetical protein
MPSAVANSANTAMLARIRYVDRRMFIHPRSTLRLQRSLRVRWHAERQAGNADHQPHRHLVAPKTSRNRSDAASATRGWSKKSPEVAMNTPSRTTRVTRSSDPRCSLAAASAPKAAVRTASRPISASNSFAQPANILRLVIHNREHAAQEEEIARLHRLDVTTKRRCGRKLNAKVLQPALRARLLTGYHRPTCAPSSTCSTSPVT